MEEKKQQPEQQTVQLDIFDNEKTNTNTGINNVSKQIHKSRRKKNQSGLSRYD